MLFCLILDNISRIQWAIISVIFLMLTWYTLNLTSRQLAFNWGFTLLTCETLLIYKCVGPTPDLLNLSAWYCWYIVYIFLLHGLDIHGILCLRIIICYVSRFCFSVKIMFIHIYKLDALFSVFFENMVDCYVYRDFCLKFILEWLCYSLLFFFQNSLLVALVLL